MYFIQNNFTLMEDNCNLNEKKNVLMYNKKREKM